MKLGQMLCHMEPQARATTKCALSWGKFSYDCKWQIVWFVMLFMEVLALHTDIGGNVSVAALTLSVASAVLASAVMQEQALLIQCRISIVHEQGAIATCMH